MSDVCGTAPHLPLLYSLFQNFSSFLNRKISGKMIFWKLSLKFCKGVNKCFLTHNISNV